MLGEHKLVKDAPFLCAGWRVLEEIHNEDIIKLEAFTLKDS